jgi:hypothetical protein
MARCVVETRRYDSVVSEIKEAQMKEAIHAGFPESVLQALIATSPMTLRHREEIRNIHILYISVVLSSVESWEGSLILYISVVLSSVESWEGSLAHAQQPVSS